MSQRTPCHFHQRPGGCRNGDRCSFLHIGLPGVVKPPSNNPENTTTLRGAHRSYGGQSRAPSGVCNEYWLSGQCRRSFDCRYRHDQRQEAAGSNSTMSFASASIEGSAAITSDGPNLNPSQVHNHMRKYLADGYRFNTPNEIYAFLKLIANATEENNWTVEDGQLLLTTLATVGNNGLLRIGDILRHQNVSPSAGMSYSALSFQRGYLPLLSYFSSEFVVKSAVNHNVNALYTLIFNDFDTFARNIQDCMDVLMKSGSFKDPKSLTAAKQVTGSHIFSCLSTVLFEYLSRFRHATVAQPRVIPLVHRLQEWLELWISGITSIPSTFEDVWASGGNADVHAFITGRLRSQVGRVVTIVDREQAAVDRAMNRILPEPLPTVDSRNAAIVANLEVGYIGPGEERPSGPRNDNDFADISRIRIAPTHEELVCQHKPFLPANIPNAPHHLPAGSIERLLDIQFRLLREELIAPLRTAVQLVLQDLRAPPRQKTTLSALISNRGGRYHGALSQGDNIIFNLYTNCAFLPFTLHPHRGVMVGMSLDAPPGSARSGSGAVRSNFWEGRGGKRLMQGGLVALVWGADKNQSIFLGIVASPLKDLADSAKRSSDERVQIRVSFFDPQAELQILQSIKNPETSVHTKKLLIEAPVMFEAIRPFLDALRVEPTSIPFGRYLAHPLSESLAGIKIEPPKYAMAPGFSFDMRCLYKTDPPETLRLAANNSSSADVCRQTLQTPESRLDPSQADAIVDALTREVALIQGPPGTGKTYIGIEILRVLLENKVRPILMIAFTNHALDHMLASVLEAGITNKILRLGSRSTDERVSKFNLDTMELVQDKSRLDSNMNRQYYALKNTQEEIDKLMNDVRKTTITGSQLDEYVNIQYPDHHASLFPPPRWVSALRLHDSSDDSEWKTAGLEKTDDSLFSYWENGRDLDFLIAQSVTATPKPRENAATNRFEILRRTTQPSSADSDSTESEAESEAGVTHEASGDENHGCAASWIRKGPVPTDTDVLMDPSVSTGASDQDSEIEGDVLPTTSSDAKDYDYSFSIFGPDTFPEIPLSNSPLEELLGNPEVGLWQLSGLERKRLGRFWRNEALQHLAAGHVEDFQRLRSRYEDARAHYNELKDQSKLRLMKSVEIVGCTTTGAAKLTSLLKGFSPKVMLVEEAGQVLEAHVLGSLVPSVEHLILIGDPLQLRPNLANYDLSVDSQRGAALYRFDVSLMERLSSSGLRMSQLQVQRRMRPSIADLVRRTLYPNLQDHNLTQQYPSVRGMGKNIFFLSHEHREAGGGEDSVSKHNMFEVKMTVDLVLYLLRQGRYSQSGDIVVLCAYLGQLVRMRDALVGKVVAVIDERDKEMLAEHEEEREETPELATVKNVPISQKVLLRTIDNFQGEEAAITIVSLVRNAGSIEDEQERVSSALRPSIGFLKSRNRTNVALSRAKHGLFILGNASNLAAKSQMWSTILDVLGDQDAVGPGFPIACSKHPEERHFISAPGMLPQYSPDGGCLRSCGEPLRCGHTCPYKCHSDDEQHISITCTQPCLRLCPRGHPCDQQCSQPCGKCCHPLLNVGLPCGHERASVPCHEVYDGATVECHEIVEKSHPTCEHACRVRCGVDPSSYMCKEICGVTLTCCGRSCTSSCHDCKALNKPLTTESLVHRTRHKSHPCRRVLICGHSCGGECSEHHTCVTRCMKPCRRSCKHATCKQPCHVVCAPCAQPCSWSCAHKGTCPVPCGSICARLPCDMRCPKMLPCGHQCPSLCGEPCSVCIFCAPVERKQDIVDLIMQTTLEEVTPGETMDDLIITLTCGHTFTVASLDGVCELEQFYRRSDSDKWIGLATPSPGFRGQPACPSCRSPITIPRYGRAFKRAGLDAAEHTVASDMTHSLKDVTTALQQFDKDKAQQDITQTVINGATTGGPDLTPDKVNKLEKAQNRILRGDGNRPVAPEHFVLAGGKRKGNIHFVPPQIANAWKSTIRPLNRAYTLAVEIALRRPAHTVAYENAFSTLYRQEMDEASKNPAQAPRRPTEFAMRTAKMKVGQPPPRADKRFSVEALWLSLKLRFLMGDLAETRLTAMQEDSKSSASDRFIWASFTRFIYLTCTRDVKLALNIAEESQSSRQIVTSHLMELRAQFEVFRFDVGMRKQQRLLEEDRRSLSKEAQAKFQEVRQAIKSITETYLSARNNESDREWLTTHFTVPISAISDQWMALERSIMHGTFYEAVSLEEVTKIVRAFEFSHTGHWYACENGHTFVITECGGATESASCPECGATIGGTNHTLHTSNIRNTEMENIARAQGAAQSPWNWGRGA